MVFTNNRSTILYSLFIDDECLPPNDNFVITRSYIESIQYMSKYGCPNYISFDHDIASEPYNGFSIAKWIIDRDLDYNLQWMPKTFNYYVHSQNTVGKENIEKLLTQYLNYKQQSLT